MSDDDSQQLTRDIAPFGVRMPADLKERVQAAAKANGRSTNAEIVATLEEKYPAGLTREQVLEFFKDMVKSGRMDESAMATVEASLSKDVPTFAIKVVIPEEGEGTTVETEIVDVRDLDEDDPQNEQHTSSQGQRLIDLDD